MTYAETFKDIETAERNRRMEIIVRLNKLWDKKQACVDEAKQKRIEKQINLVARQERSWMKEVAWFLY